MGTVIAIDGPAGSGKSTVAKIVAERLGLFYVDTGAMYRALTLKALREGLDLKDEKGLEGLAYSTDVSLDKDRVFLDLEDVTDAVRSPEVTKNTSFIAKVGGLRKRMVQLQRKLASRGAVVEGRDIGTVVFPDAEKKFYLDADFAERVRRRYEQLAKQGKEVPISQIEKEEATRDHKDMNREIAPLRKASDAIYIDTTHMTIKEVVEKITKYVREDSIDISNPKR